MHDFWFIVFVLFIHKPVNFFTVEAEVGVGVGVGVGVDIFKPESESGLEKTRVFCKKPAGLGFLWVLCGFYTGFSGFIWVFRFFVFVAFAFTISSLIALVDH